MAIRLPRKTVHDVETTEACAPSRPSEPPATLDLLSIAEAAAFAGVAQVTMRRWVRERQVPAWRVGVQIRIDRADLVKFMRRY